MKNASLEYSRAPSSVDVSEEIDLDDEGHELTAFLSSPVSHSAAIDSREKISRSFRLTLRIVLSTLTLGLFFSAYDLYRAVYTDAWSPTPDPAIMKQQHPCGTDAREARLAGCFFDPISVAWLPSRCHDFELAAEFGKLDVAGDGWQYWESGDGLDSGVPISLENVMQDQHTELWVRESYLRQRCTFTWRKLHRAILGPGEFVDAYTAGWDGVIECEELLAIGRWRADHDVLRRVEVGFPSCDKIPWA